MSNAKLDAIEKKLQEDLAQLEDEYKRRLEQLNDIDNDPALEPPVTLESGFGTCVVMLNVPVVPEGVLGKLLTVIGKIAAKCGAIDQDRVYLPVDPETKKTMGFCILQYTTEAEAKAALKALDGLVLDPRHTFKVLPYSALEAAANTPDVYATPEVLIPDKPNLKHWMMDPRGCDQFLIHYDRNIEVAWNTIDYTITWNDPAQRTPETYTRKDDFALNFTAWSPRGSYMLTAHPLGVMLWGGSPPFSKPLAKFDHPGVSKIDFSPCEKYLVTASVATKGKPEDAKEDDPKTVVFHDIATGKKKMEFVGVKSNLWPLFRFSHDDAFFASTVKDKIQIYETATMQLLNGKSIKVPGVKMFAWSPSANVMAYYVPESGNERPAGVSLLEVPSKIVLRQKNLFDVKDCRLHWHPSGQFLAVKVDRLTGNKKKAKSARVLFGRDLRATLQEQDPDMDPMVLNRKVDELWEKANAKTVARYEALAAEDKERFSKELNFFTSFQVFRMERKGIPIEEVEFDKKDPVVAFAWQNSGNLFAVIHGRSVKPDVSIWQVGKETELTKLKTFEARMANHLFWSPVGDFLVLANVKSAQGNLEFVNSRSLESITTGEHAGATSYEWDPRGRFFVSSVSAWRQQSETGYYMWSFNGRLLAKVTKPKFYEFHFRPRPPTLLSASEEKRILKNMKETSKQLEKEDELRRRLERREFYESRGKQRREFYARVQAAKVQFEAEAAKKRATIYTRYAKLDESLQTVVMEEEKIIDEKTTTLGV